MTGLESAYEFIDQFVELKMKEVNVPGLTMAVTGRDEVLRISAYGYSDIATRAPMTPNSGFEIASLSKAFTSIALLQLREEGKLDLHAPVTEYLPWFKVRSEYPPITVHHLLSHTAGIVRGSELAPHGLYDSWALRETKAYVAPGESWSYSSLGYKTLGFLLERLTGQSYQEVIQSRILDPLGMTHTQTAITFETRKKTASGHSPYYDDRPEHASHGHVPAIWAEYGTADGCLVSTAGDMAIFLRMLLNRGKKSQGRVISEESFGLLTQRAIPIGNAYYGYGLVEYQVDGRTYIGHGGGNAGFMSQIVVDIEDGLGIVVLVNSLVESDVVGQVATFALKDLQAAYHNRPLPPRPPAADRSSIQNAADYAGVYRNGNRFLFLTATYGKLLLEYEGRVVPLERRGPDIFYVGHPDFSLFPLEFKRDIGKVVEVFHGSDWYVSDHYSGPRDFDYPEEWDAYLGHYRARNPELSNFRVVLRKGSLLLLRPSGGAESLVPLGGGFCRIGQHDSSAETLRFEAVVEGRALRADYSGCPYYRTFTP